MAANDTMRKIMYRTWQGMKRRCYNPKCSEYKYYGARGITICDRWLDSFDAFFADMGPRPVGHSIDRIDNDLGYAPENCRWATPGVQRRNQRACFYIEHAGRRMVLRDWAQEVGISELTLWSRIRKRGWSIEKALTTPPLSSEEASLAGRAAQTNPSRRIQRNNSTGFKGVSFHRGHNRYRAQINIGGKQRFIGEYMTPEEAAHAYNKASIQFHGDLAVLNPVHGIFTRASKGGQVMRKGLRYWALSLLFLCWDGWNRVKRRLWK